MIYAIVVLYFHIIADLDSFIDKYVSVNFAFIPYAAVVAECGKIFNQTVLADFYIFANLNHFADLEILSSS